MEILYYDGLSEHPTAPLHRPDRGDHKLSEKRGLPKPPLFTSDYILIAEILDFALDRFGQLVLALMYYTADETVPEDLPPDLKAMFAIYQKKIDAAREKYEKVCVTRAESGAKGGRAKAENAKANGSVPKFKPPTQRQFQEAVKHFADEGEISDDTGNYEADAFFDELRDANWSIGGEPIVSRFDWEAAILAKFYDLNVALPHRLYYQIFTAIFANFHGLRDENGRCQANEVAYDFVETTYEKQGKHWIVQGEEFPTPYWKEALDRFMARYSKY